MFCKEAFGKFLLIAKRLNITLKHNQFMSNSGGKSSYYHRLRRLAAEVRTIQVYETSTPYFLEEKPRFEVSLHESLAAGVIGLISTRPVRPTPLTMKEGRVTSTMMSLRGMCPTPIKWLRTGLEGLGGDCRLSQYPQ